jgi:hypothetical protein
MTNVPPRRPEGREAYPQAARRHPGVCSFLAGLHPVDRRRVISRLRELRELDRLVRERPVTSEAVTR